MWIGITASNGVKIADDATSGIGALMTPTQIADAQKLARECVRKKYKGC